MLDLRTGTPLIDREVEVPGRFYSSIIAHEFASGALWMRFIAEGGSLEVLSGAGGEWHSYLDLCGPREVCVADRIVAADESLVIELTRDAIHPSGLRLIRTPALPAWFDSGPARPSLEEVARQFWALGPICAGSRRTRGVHLPVDRRVFEHRSDSV